MEYHSPCGSIYKWAYADGGMQLTLLTKRSGGVNSSLLRFFFCAPCIIPPPASQRSTHACTVSRCACSDIRGAMVKIMLAPASRRQAAFGIGGGGAGQPSAVAIGNAFGGGKELPMDPSTCMFWCAVALGALVKGSPVESVRVRVSSWCIE